MSALQDFLVMFWHLFLQSLGVLNIWLCLADVHKKKKKGSLLFVAPVLKGGSSGIPPLQKCLCEKIRQASCENQVDCDCVVSKQTVSFLSGVLSKWPYIGTEQSLLTVKQRPVTANRLMSLYRSLLIGLFQFVTLCQGVCCIMCSYVLVHAHVCDLSLVTETGNNYSSLTAHHAPSTSPRLCLFVLLSSFVTLSSTLPVILSTTSSVISLSCPRLFAFTQQEATVMTNS